MVENANPGALYSIDLLSGTKTAIISGLYNASGLLIDKAVANAYISERLGALSPYYQISQINLVTGAKTPTNTIFYYSVSSLSWADPSQGSIIISFPVENAIQLLNILNLMFISPIFHQIVCDKSTYCFCAAFPVHHLGHVL